MVIKSANLCVIDQGRFRNQNMWDIEPLFSHTPFLFTCSRMLEYESQRRNFQDGEREQTQRRNKTQDVALTHSFNEARDGFKEEYLANQATVLSGVGR